MAQVSYLCLSSMYATGLENKRGHKAQSPSLALSISSGCRWVLSRPAINGGKNPRWNDMYILQFETLYCKTATLTVIILHRGKNYDTNLGEVCNIPVSNLTQGHQELQVLNESGTVGGLLRFYARVVTPTPTLQSFTICAHYAQGLKYVKPWWKRISLRNLSVRKMRPYVVVESNVDRRRWVSLIAKSGGKDPRWDFCHTFTCNTSLIQNGEVNFTIELLHRHKAENHRDPSDKDITIGFVENIKVYRTEQRRIEHFVETPKGEDGGKLYVSMALWEPEQQKHEILTPSPTIPSWQPRYRLPGRGPFRPFRARKIVDQLIKGVGPVSGTILAGLGVAAAVG